MCGIAGWINLPSAPNGTLDKMLNLIRHRGPDESRTFADREFVSGMMRLAINGISNGSQPLFSYSGKIALLYNGEIYNSPELKSELEKKGINFQSDSDGEVLCHLFEMEGPKAFNKLDGMFAAALWNRETRQLTLVRDLPGEKPLYYANHPAGGTVFASELKAFAGFPGLNFTLDQQSIADFPTFLWIPEPSTIFRGVKSLPCGHYLELSSDKQPNLVSYKEDSSTPLFATEEEAVYEIRKTLDDSIEARLLSDVRLGAFLSGGLDSSIIATQAARQLTSLSTFCIGFEAADDPYHGEADESSAAEATAKLIGSTHHTIRVQANDFRNSLESFSWYGDQPFAVSSGLGILHIAKKAKAEGIKVLLSGDGADECFGGYSWYEHLVLGKQIRRSDPEKSILFAHDTGFTVNERLAKISELNGPQQARAWHYYASEDDKRELFDKDFIEGLQSSTRIFSEWKDNPKWSPEDFIAQDRDCYLPFEMLRKVDRMTMAHSVEARTPFTSPSVLSLANRIPYSMMTGPNVLKKTLRKAYADILPEAVTIRPKHGFNVPIDLWLKNEWSDLLQEAFSPQSALSKQGIISKQSLKKASNMLANPRRLNGHTLFCFIMLNLWLEQSYGNYC